MLTLEEKIKHIIDKFLPEHNFKNIINYSLYPAGKLFRARLCLALAKDMQLEHEDCYFIAAAIEAHHTYTLIHDDLPSMDNDDYRRGRLSNHKKFNESSAILAGDALLSLSYEILTNLETTDSIKDVICYFSKMVGPRGLILGQVLDLETKELK